ncbi:hypothetical protein LEP1GSC037_1478 [Leptospira interrogans str. 2006001854]|uniref:Uncharacterized protein n=1 Tax=Leptospira interrogans str. 2006001854 TaxID=1001590 RepID=M6H0G6_LEPIR|nr:hypothetical protein LEP1GSC037_1478 [Leptospira interrogans str. 2006001854]
MTLRKEKSETTLIRKTNWKSKTRNWNNFAFLASHDLQEPFKNGI